MTVVETVLVYIGIPAGITALLALMVFGRSLAHQPNRYRPGRPWKFEPVWFVPHPDALPNHPETRVAITGAIEGSASTSAVGGASGEW